MRRGVSFIASYLYGWSNEGVKRKTRVCQTVPWILNCTWPWWKHALLLFGVYAGVIWLASCDIYLTVLDDFCNDLCMEACVFPQQQNFAMVSLFSPDKLWCDPVQLQCQVLGKVPEGSGGFRCRYLLRFRRVPVQIPGEVLEGSGSGGFRCRYLLRFRRVSVQIPCEVLDGCISHTDIQILIVMMINADSTCDQCALDGLKHFRKTVFHEAHVWD